MRTSGFSTREPSAAAGLYGVTLWRSAQFLREAVSMLRAKLKGERTGIQLTGEHGILRDRAVLVFDLHVEVIAAKDGVPEIQHPRQFAGGEAMRFIVFCDPGLERTDG